MTSDRTQAEQDAIEQKHAIGLLLYLAAHQGTLEHDACVYMVGDHLAAGCHQHPSEYLGPSYIWLKAKGEK